jgi:alcohol dehydrogenase (cytochrome c)
LKSAIVGTPVSYMLDGRQYVAVFAGWDGAVARQGPLAAALARIPRGGRLYVFALR